jgi:hypothetical protein
VEEVKRTCAELTAGDLSFRIMHPVLCVVGRVATVLTLHREDTLTLSQLRAAVICAREFLRDLLALGKLRLVLNWIKHIHMFALTKDGIEIYHRFQIDVLKAIPDDGANLPYKFLNTRFPQIQGQVAFKRERLSALFHPHSK